MWSRTPRYNPELGCPSRMTQSNPAAADLYPRRWIALFTMLMTNFMTLVDISIVNVALPSIRSDLALGENRPPVDRSGFCSRAFPGAIAHGTDGRHLRTQTHFPDRASFVFSVASLLCGLAPAGGFLIAARVLQGASTAMMIPQTLAICQDMFDAEERGTAFALFGLVASMAAVSGPALGGALIEANLFGAGWRPIFLINLPVGLLALTLGLRNIPNIPGRRHLGVDWMGTAIASRRHVLPDLSDCRRPRVGLALLGLPATCSVGMLVCGPLVCGRADRNVREDRNSCPCL